MTSLLRWCSTVVVRTEYLFSKYTTSSAASLWRLQKVTFAEKDSYIIIKISFYSCTKGEYEFIFRHTDFSAALSGK